VYLCTKWISINRNEGYYDFNKIFSNLNILGLYLIKCDEIISSKNNNNNKAGHCCQDNNCLPLRLESIILGTRLGIILVAINAYGVKKKATKKCYK